MHSRRFSNLKLKKHNSRYKEVVHKFNPRCGKKDWLTSLLNSNFTDGNFSVAFPMPSVSEDPLGGAHQTSRPNNNSSNSVLAAVGSTAQGQRCRGSGASVGSGAVGSGADGYARGEAPRGAKPP